MNNRAIYNSSNISVESEDSNVINYCDLVEISKTYIEVMNNVFNKKDHIILLLDNSKHILQVKRSSKIHNELKEVRLRIGNLFCGDKIREQYDNIEINIKEIEYYNRIIGFVVILTIPNNIHSKEGVTKASFTFDDIIGKSKSLLDILDTCRAIANSPSTVLIEGESGTGKEVLAQSIHNYSDSRDENFVAINCGAIPENIIESELFGYEDGTFTGGKKGGKIGRLEYANGGTLFLDEIGDMPKNMQVKLLRVLQSGKFTRLGGNEEISIEVRVIAATNKDLREEVRIGNFREDLYFRLCVIPIRIPPLRERKEDILELIHYFLRIKANMLNKDVPKISRQLLEKLIKYNWPGNIRELENSIENIVNLDGRLSFDLLDDDYSMSKGNNDNRSFEYINEYDYTDLEYNKDLKEKNIKIRYDGELTIEEVEKKLILTTIESNNNNIAKSARDLGISRNTLYLKLRKYDIDNNKLYNNEYKN